MGTISTRVPDDLEAELEASLEDETLDRSTAVRKLLSEGLEDWRREQALDSLAAGWYCAPDVYAKIIKRVTIL